MLGLKLLACIFRKPGEDVNVAHGLGALSTAHSGEEVELLAEACRRAGRRIKGYL
jgi:hypothetical protein